MPKGIPSKKSSERDLAAHEVLFLQSIREFLPSLRLHPDRLLISKIGYDKLEDSSLQFKAFMEYGTEVSLMKNEYLALSHQMWKCLARYIQNVGTSVTLSTLLNSIGLLESAVNDSFPGYSASRLLQYIISPLVTVKDSVDRVQLDNT